MIGCMYQGFVTRWQGSSSPSEPFILPIHTASMQTQNNLDV